MMGRLLAAALAVATAVALCGGTSEAQTRYDYGGGSRYGTGEEGFLLFLEAGLANPRNTDNVVAASGPNVIIPQWSDEPAGRIGFGYRFSGGSEIVASFWGTEAEQSETGIGSFEFPIGPIDGFGFDVTTEIRAGTGDVAWVVPYEPVDGLLLAWSAGLRLASFEETTRGTYDTTSGTLDVAKSLEGTMLGARLGGRASYGLGPWFFGAGLGLSLVDGEIEAAASLTPPSGTLPLALTDDSRSGTMLDVDARAGWRNADENVAVWIGWERQDWDGIAADLARNPPGSEVITRSRDSVSFSWFKAGVEFRF